MREILFRGKSIEVIEMDRWVHGFYDNETYNEVYEVFCSKDTRHYINNQDDTVEVNPDTIGQYIGLRDNNGKRIYEGDIVTAEYGELKKIGYVFYYERGAKFGIRENSGYDNLSLLFDKTIKEWNIRVIGNIYDNPRLLGV